jgi:alanine-synthesizing transaminase
VLIVQGSGFNWIAPDHFRVVFLPNTDDMTEAFGRIAKFMESYRKRHGSSF